MWVLAAMFAMNLLQGQQKSGQIEIQNKVAKKNAAIQNQLTEASNKVAAAQGALNRFQRSVSNQNILKNAANYNSSLASNLGRLQEQSQRGDINTRLQAAEQTGALIASAGAAGVAGSTVAAIDSVIKGRAARQLQQSKYNTKLATSDTLERMRQVNEAASASLDNITAIDRVTSVQQIAQQQEVPNLAQNAGQAALSVLGTQAGQDAVGTIGGSLTSWFKTPQAGANLQVEGFNPAPAVASPSFFNVKSAFGSQ